MARLYTSFWIYPYLTPLSKIQLLASLNGDDVGRMSEWVDRMWFVWDADVGMEGGKPLLSEVTSLLIAGEVLVSPKLSRFCFQENCEEV
jgi:hypothetical protein